MYHGGLFNACRYVSSCEREVHKWKVSACGNDQNFVRFNEHTKQSREITMDVLFVNIFGTAKYNLLGAVMRMPAVLILSTTNANI